MKSGVEYKLLNIEELAATILSPGKPDSPSLPRLPPEQTLVHDRKIGQRQAWTSNEATAKSTETSHLEALCPQP